LADFTGDFPQQGRYGQGVIACKLPARTDLVGALVGKKTTSGWIHLEVLAAKQVRIDEIPMGKRGGAGKELVPVKAGDVALALSAPFDSLEFWEGKVAVVKPKAAPKAREVEQPTLLEVGGEGAKKTPPRPPAESQKKRLWKKRRKNRPGNLREKGQPALP
jgi:hypothetical protein